MNLPWAEAAQLLRETYRAQVGLSPGYAPRHMPERDLWAEFRQWRAACRDALRRAWDEQTRHEKDRRGAVKAAFYRARSAIADRKDLTVTDRREQLSGARVARLEAEAALRDRTTTERDAIKDAGRQPITDQYRRFLQERAQSGDERALRELRRMQQLHLRTKRADDERAVNISGPSHGAKQPVGPGHNEIIYRGPSITYEVHASGEVDYRKDGVAFLVDEGRTLRLWDSEREAIELALRFAHRSSVRHCRYPVLTHFRPLRRAWRLTRTCVSNSSSQNWRACARSGLPSSMPKHSNAGRHSASATHRSAMSYATRYGTRNYRSVAIHPPGGRTPTRLLIPKCPTAARLLNNEPPACCPGM